MKNEKIINAWNKLEPNEKIEYEIYNNIIQKYKKRHIFKPKKIIAMAAAVILIFGLCNIQIVMAFFSGLFFVPFVGFIPDENAVVMMYNADEPVYIQCDGKTFKLDRAVKVKSDNINFMYFEISTNDVNMSEGLFSYDVTLWVKDKGERKEANITGGGASANYGKNAYERYEQGYVENLSDSTEIEIAVNTSEFMTVKFDVTEDMLIYGSIAEINGITVTAMMKKDDYSRIDMAYYSSNVDGNKYRFNSHTFDLTVYAEDGSVIPFKGERGWDNFYTTDVLNNAFSMTSIVLDNPENKKVASIKTDCINTQYSLKNNNNALTVEVPVPADGETIKSDIKYNFSDVDAILMTKIERKGDTLFYDTPEMKWYTEHIKERKKAVKNNEILPTIQTFYPYANDIFLEHSLMEKTITGITDNIKTLTIQFVSIHVSYFGNWEIKFK